jgi:glycosyltransferase family 2
MVSVIVPVYKAEFYLDKCIKSILGQTYDNIELLLINDGSPDRSGEICDRYAQTDERIKVFHKQNAGVSAARNTGLMNAHGKWIIFVDSDDWLEVDCIEKCLKLINEYHLDFLQFGLKRVDDNGRVLSADGKETAVLSAEEYIRTGKIGICVGGGIFKADIIQAANLRFDTDLKLGEDQLFVYRYISKCKYCNRINNLFYNYRANAESACTISNPQECIKSIKAFQKFELRRIFEPYIQRSILRYFLYPIIRSGILTVRQIYILIQTEKFEMLVPNRKIEKIFLNLYKCSKYAGIFFLRYTLS